MVFNHITAICPAGDRKAGWIVSRIKCYRATFTAPSDLFTVIQDQALWYKITLKCYFGIVNVLLAPI